ncbi:MAG: TRAP transporter TatT component family protein [Desulfobacterales bacterium]|nr:TRAP transporter TatT component family protein [Desulfobacterales bacterium]
MARAVLLIGLCLGLILSGCSVKTDLMTNLSDTIVNNDDLEMVEAGAPAYLIMIDSLIAGDPDSEEMLSTASRLYSAYADVFVTDPERSRKLADKAVGYALQAICLADDDACGLKTLPYEEFKIALADLDEDELPYLFSLGTAWSGWIMAHRDDFNALADISRIEDIMVRVTQLDDSYQDGAAYLYLGALATLLPPALGGKPEQGRQYFERALSLSHGRNLMVKVMYARLYAKMVFDRELHDRLLNEVLEADPHVPGYTLVNTYARQNARKLLDEADEYF